MARPVVSKLRGESRDGFGASGVTGSEGGEGGGDGGDDGGGEDRELDALGPPKNASRAAPNSVRTIVGGAD